jgi:hypothetical protein
MGGGFTIRLAQAVETPTRLDIGAGDLAWAPVTEELRHHDKLRPLRVGQSIDAGEYVFDTTVWVSWAKNPLQTA